jgi:hypothetical protein
LSKTEVFAACQALADADRCLNRSGALGEAEALADLFELLEERLALEAQLPAQSESDAASSVASSVGSNSMDSEFTQYR